jgi:hypothetical protein
LICPEPDTRERIRAPAPCSRTTALPDAAGSLPSGVHISARDRPQVIETRHKSGRICAYFSCTTALENAGCDSAQEARMVLVLTRNQPPSDRPKRRAVLQSAIVAILAALTMTHAAAQFRSADDLHTWCSSNRSMASAYAAGMADEATHSLYVLDSFKPMSNADSASSALIATTKIGTELIGGSCRPPDATLDQVTDALCNFLRDFPRDRHAPPALVFGQAMGKRWPCQQPQ